MIRTGTLIFLLLGIFTTITHAQTDTLKLNLPQAEALFLKQNFDLLAANYQIDQAKAEIITARLFDNPELEYENLLYNHETGKFLQTSYAYGQFAGSVSQLIKLAGKRNKNIKLAQSGVRMAEMEYFDVQRTLKFELQNTFYKAYFTAQSVNVFDEQIKSTQMLIKAYETQLKAGNVALKDVIRIKSLLIGLQAEQTNLLNELEDQYRDLRMLCGLAPNANLSLALASAEPDLPLNQIPYLTLLDSARNLSLIHI